MKRTELVIMEVMLALLVFGVDKEGEVMIKGKNISKNFVSRKIFLLLVIAVILLLVGIHFRTKSSSDISVKDAQKHLDIHAAIFIDLLPIHAIPLGVVVKNVFI